MKKAKQIIKYLSFDYLAAAIAWTIFYSYRRIFIESKITDQSNLYFDQNFILGVIIIPIFWITIYYITGYYYEIYRKSRLKELYQTFTNTLFGVLFIFFKLILDDIITSYTDYYQSLVVLLSVHFILTYFPRVIITSVTIKKIHKRKIGFKSILVGENGHSMKVFNEINSLKKSPGNIFIGYISIDDKKNEELEKNIPLLGDFENLYEIIVKEEIDEVIIAIESSEHQKIQKILNKLLLTNARVKILPSDYDIASGYVKMVSAYQTPFIEINNRSMSITQENIKRITDVMFSSLALIIAMPVFLVVALGVKLSSKGPVFYKQERVGRGGKPFYIFKFRTMFIDAEKNGPALSSLCDPRVTKFGRFLRKTRLDEIPQFLNVLLGQMSIVGPRPERQYYIEKIVERTPYYLTLLKVKPGITSLGQVKYGYAENVDQMVERTKFDLVYLQNMSLYLDFKIMILTVKTVLEASGK